MYVASIRNIVEFFTKKGSEKGSGSTSAKRSRGVDRSVQKALSVTGKDRRQRALSVAVSDSQIHTR